MRVVRCFGKEKSRSLINVAFGMFLPPAASIILLWGVSTFTRHCFPPIAARLDSEGTDVREEYTGSRFYICTRIGCRDIILQEKPALAFRKTTVLFTTGWRNWARLSFTGAGVIGKRCCPRIRQDEEKATYAPPLTRDDEK